MPQTYNRDGTTSLLPICPVCHRQMARSGRAIAALRADSHIYDGWTHRGCSTAHSQRPHRVRRTAARPTASAVAQPQFQNVNLSLDSARADKSIDIKKYDNMFIGVELESSGLSEVEAKRILGFQHEIGHTDGKVYAEKKIRSGDFEVKFKDEKDLYLDRDLVTQIYHDGSVGTEVVLRPLPLSRWSEFRAIHKKLKDAGADFFANGAAGCHMTFLTDFHKSMSSFDKLVVQNVMQFTRVFYWDIIQAFPGKPGKTRSVGYRALPVFNEMNGLSTTHYTAISLRQGNDGNIWGVEVRMPDGSNDFDTLELQARFWSAVFRECALIARHGLLNFPQTHWDVVRSSRLTTSGASISVYQAHGQLNPQIDKILKGSLEHFRFYEAPETEETYQTVKTSILNKLRGE